MLALGWLTTRIRLRTLLLTGAVCGVGSVLAGPLFGLAQAFGFRWAFVFSVVLCGAGLAILLVVRPQATFGGRVRLAASR